MFNAFKSSVNLGVNVVFTGQSRSGKTTLLYSSLVGSFEECPKIQPTLSLNFERLEYLKKQLLIWDTPGHTAFIHNLLPVLLSSIKIRALVYVVNLLQGEKLVFDEISNDLRSILFNQKLASCKFCVIFNTFGSGSDSWPKQPGEFANLLGLCYLPPQIDNRTRWFVVNTAKGFSDRGWRMAVEFILFGSTPNIPYYTNVPDFELTPVHYYYSQYDNYTPYGQSFRQFIPYDYIASQNIQNTETPNLEKPKSSKFSKLIKLFKK